MAQNAENDTYQGRRQERNRVNVTLPPKPVKLAKHEEHSASNEN